MIFIIIIISLYSILVVLIGERNLKYFEIILLLNSNLLFFSYPFILLIIKYPNINKRFRINLYYFIYNSLLFWALFDLLLFLEKTFPIIDIMFPFPYLVRLIFLLWLIQFDGAMGFYDYVIEPLCIFLWKYFKIFKLFDI